MGAMEEESRKASPHPVLNVNMWKRQFTCSMGAMEEMSGKGEDSHIGSSVLVDFAVGEGNFAVEDVSTTALPTAEHVKILGSILPWGRWRKCLVRVRVLTSSAVFL